MQTNSARLFSDDSALPAPRKRARRRTKSVKVLLPGGKRIYIGGYLSEQDRDHLVKKIALFRTEVRLGHVSAAEADARVMRMVQGPPTLGPMLARFIAAQKGLRTRERYENLRRVHFGPLLDVQAEQLTATRVTTWLQSIPTEPTRKLCWRLLRAAVGRAVQDRQVPAMPWGPLRPKFKANTDPRESARDEDEVIALLKTAQEIDLEYRKQGRFSDRTNRLIWFLYTGCRNSEGVAISWDCFVRDENGAPIVAHIRYQSGRCWQAQEPSWKRPQYPPKNGPRTLALHPVVSNALIDQEQLLRARGWYREDGPVFPAVRTGTWAADSTCIDVREIKEIAHEAGLPNPNRWNVHSLRDTFTTMEARGLSFDLKTLALRTGHKSLSALLLYLKQIGRGVPQPGTPDSARIRQALGMASASPPPSLAAGSASSPTEETTP